MAKFQVILERQVTERVVIDIDVKAKDVKSWMGGSSGMVYARLHHWKDYVDNYIYHQVDLSEEVVNSKSDIETLGNGAWQVMEAIVE